MTATPKIYVGIPVPPRKVRSGNKNSFDQLAVGASIYFDPKLDTTGLPEDIEKTASRIMGSVARFRRSQGSETLKFAVRVCAHPDTGEQVVGVWRTA